MGTKHLKINKLKQKKSTQSKANSHCAGQFFRNGNFIVS